LPSDDGGRLLAFYKKSTAKMKAVEASKRQRRE
jgi:hypothetical protein